MKITLEINDETLHKAIGQQLDATIAAFMERELNRRIEDIVKTKFDRIGPNSFEEAMQHAATDLIQSSICFNENPTPYSLRQRVQAIMASEAQALIKSAMKG